MQHFDLVFDRQAVAIPAWHVGRVEPGQGFGAHDDVFQQFIHRMAEVNIAIGIGRAVVQHEARAAFGGGADFVVQLLFLPGLDPARFTLGQVAPHGKGRVGHVEGFAVIGHGFYC